MPQSKRGSRVNVLENLDADRDLRVNARRRDPYYSNLSRRFLDVPRGAPAHPLRRRADKKEVNV